MNTTEQFPLGHTGRESLGSGMCGLETGERWLTFLRDPVHQVLLELTKDSGLSLRMQTCRIFNRILRQLRQVTRLGMAGTPLETWYLQLEVERITVSLAKETVCPMRLQELPLRTGTHLSSPVA